MELDRMLRNPEILTITGVSNATIWRWIKGGIFPAPVRLGPHAVGWRESDVLEWLESREPVGTRADRSPAPEIGERPPSHPRS